MTPRQKGIFRMDGNDAVARVVQAYYDILGGGAASFDQGRHLRPLLASDLEFEGPIAGHVVGAERFVRGVSGFVETVRRIAMLHQICAEGIAATLYDAEMPGGIVRFAEFFQIDGGKIQTLRLMYDPAEYRARGGR